MTAGEARLRPRRRLGDEERQTPVLRAKSGTWRGRVDKIFGSLAVRHGIKVRPCRVLVFIALFLRLPELT
jgi:hypothetical protein